MLWFHTELGFDEDMLRIYIYIVFISIYICVCVYTYRKANVALDVWFFGSHSNKHGSWARNGNVRRNTFRNITYV